MRVVGSAAGIKLHAEEDAYFSYFNSPYIGHDLGSAVDIYPHHQEWGGPIVSPISGQVIKIKKVKMGQPKQFPTNNFDYGIGILSEESDSDIARVLHCQPTISEGERVEVGDTIGTAIRSRYFNYWTGPHYHVEILSSESFQRSSKSYPLDLDYHFKSRPMKQKKEAIEFLVESVTKDHLIGFAKNLANSTIRDLTGLSAFVDDRIVGILDGGLPHYKVGGVIGTEDPKEGNLVNLVKTPIGIVTETKSCVSVFDRGPSITFFLNNTETRGISCFIYPKLYTKKKAPQMILIPKKYGQFVDIFNEGELCEFSFKVRNNMVKAE